MNPIKRRVRQIMNNCEKFGFNPAIYSDEELIFLCGDIKEYLYYRNLDEEKKESED